MGIFQKLGGLLRQKKEIMADELKRYFMMGIGSKFVMDIYKDRVLTPHEEKKEARKLYNRNAWVMSAVNTLKDMIIGRELSIKTSDTALKSFMESWIKQSGFDTALNYAIENALITGDGYIEKGITKTGKIIRAYPVPQAEYIYIDADEFGNTKGYIQELKGMKAKFKSYTINYGGMVRTISGKYISAEKLVHIKFGVSQIPIYGRSPIASTINDGRILLEIERSMAVYSRFKATPKKLIAFPEASDQEIQAFQEMWKKLDDTENIVVNQNPTVQDLSYTGATADMTNIVEYLKRKLTVALAPEYIIHGEDTNRATAKEQRLMTLLRIQSIRNQILPPINKFLKDVAVQNGFSAEDLELEFGSFDFDTEEDKINKAINLFNNGLITLNEARGMIGLPLQEGELGDSYKWELSETNPLSQLFSQDNKNDQSDLEER